MTTEEVTELLTSLDSSKAPGPDNLPTIELKKCANTLAPSITAFINSSFLDGYCLSALFGKNYWPTYWIARLTEAWGQSKKLHSVRGGQYEMVVGEGEGSSPAPPLNPLRAACFQNGSPSRTLDLEQAKKRLLCRLGNVCPVHKKDKKTEVENYLSISLMPILAEVQERCVLNRLLTHISHCLFNMQHSCCKSSMTLAGLLIVDWKLMSSI